ncbi:MAG: hypothetical protein JWQ17_1444 [Tardiphaga sp.]|nr:hypothetical protein [Tardiphaga sp.]
MRKALGRRASPPAEFMSGLAHRRRGMVHKPRLPRHAGTSLHCRTMIVASQQNTTPIRRPLRQTRLHEWIFFVGMTIKVN